MSMTDIRSGTAGGAASKPGIDFKLEVVVVPVADLDRAKHFYGDALGWRLDADRQGGGRRVLQFTPPGSACSVMFGTGLTSAPPGSAQYLHLVVSDIEAAQADLARRGVETSGVFHDSTGGYNRFDPAVRAAGRDPSGRTYASYVTFSDPDGNLWLLQEVTARLPGRIDSGATCFASVADLVAGLTRAAIAHGEHEKRLGSPDKRWPDWYAAYLAAEQSGAPPPE